MCFCLGRIFHDLCLKTMTKAIAITIFIGVFALYMPGVQIAATFNSDRLRVLDQTETSFLVRGNAPLNRHGVFDPAMLLSHVQDTIAQRPLDRLIVVSLLSSTHSDEKIVLKGQRGFYDDSHSSEGNSDLHERTSGGKTHEFFHRPVVGSWLALPAFIKIPILNNFIWNYWKPDDGALKIAHELNELLNRHENTAVYFHCMRGMDRTGLVAGAYMSRWKSASEKDIRDQNYSVAKRELNVPARTALEWIFWSSSKEKALH